MKSSSPVRSIISKSSALRKLNWRVQGLGQDAGRVLGLGQGRALAGKMWVLGVLARMYMCRRYWVKGIRLQGILVQKIWDPGGNPGGIQVGIQVGS